MQVILNLTGAMCVYKQHKGYNTVSLCNDKHPTTTLRFRLQCSECV